MQGLWNEDYPLSDAYRGIHSCNSTALTAQAQIADRLLHLYGRIRELAAIPANTLAPIQLLCKKALKHCAGSRVLISVK